ncbi:MAG: helix-turn-helix transcriptional regulator [Alphaproteobacteria bacterium]|nr:helix-turn-helix transcriptional regulator [Alphaproteobacteria bacterium]
MAVVLVDTKYFGHYLRHARNTLNLKRCQCANMLGVSHRDLIRIENGKMLMPEKIVERIMTNGLTMILCKRRN